jgi:hypothetical protein
LPRLLLRSVLPISAVLSLFAGINCLGQDASQHTMSDDELALAVAKSLSPNGVVPIQRGFSASVVSSSQYDSITDWSNVMALGVAYRFTRSFSVDVATPIFLYMRSERTAPNGDTETHVRHAVPGDTVMAAHAVLGTFHAKALGYFSDTLTGSLSAPTGSSEDGIGAGKTTYNFTNHLQSQSWLAPYLDLGVGTSSRLTNPLLQRSQTSRGNLLNLGVGVSVVLPRASAVYLEGYEQLPMGTQTVFQVDPRYGRPATSQSKGLAEDNGINLSTDIPVAPHVVWSGFYSHALRLHEDTVGFAFTLLLRRTPDRSPR